ncbi:MAG: PorV/PorQ family protein [FCB group bacterium]|nr:PorV/PorQ family protein [FCB group bacterium]
MKLHLTQIVKKINLLGILLIPVFLQAQSTFEILNIPHSARDLALTQSGSALSNHNISTNPASMVSDEVVLFLDYLQYPADIALHSVSGLYPLQNSLFAFSLINLDYGSLKDSESLISFSARDLVFQAAWKTQLWNSLSAGVSVKYLYSKIADYSANGAAVTVGLRTRLLEKRLGIGLSLENFGRMFSSYDEKRESLPSAARLGLYYQPIHLPAVLSVDVLNYQDSDPKFVGGIEFSTSEKFVIRVSSSSYKKDLEVGEFNEKFISGMAGGIGLKFTEFNIDISFQDMGPAGVVSGFGIQYRF